MVITIAITTRPITQIEVVEVIEAIMEITITMEKTIILAITHKDKTMSVKFSKTLKQRQKTNKCP